MPLVVLAIAVISLRAQGNVEDSRWETVARCTKKYEGQHGPEHHPYVAYGHRIRKGERLIVRLIESGGDSVLGKDLKEICALFRHLGKDSLLVACLAYQVEPYKLLGYGRIPRSTLIRKLEAGNRDICADSIRYCYYKGKEIPLTERGRKGEYRLLFMPQRKDSRDFTMIHGCLVVISCLKKVKGDR